MQADDFFYSALREQVLVTCGIKTLCMKDCREISIKIFEKDKNYISETTIKSFFGLLSNTNTPSPFVLDSLARFTGYIRWDNFKRKSIVTTGYTGYNNPACIATPLSTLNRFNH